MTAKLSRRAFTALMLAGLLPRGLAGQAAADAAAQLVPTAGVQGSYASVVMLARARAQSEAKLRSGRLTAPFADLSYDAYRAIRPAPQPLGEAGTGLMFDPLPPGLVFANPVALSVIDGAQTFDLPFDPALFDFDPAFFDADDIARLKDSAPEGDLGYSGVRLRVPLNRPDRLDEVAVFQGASYFRAVARGMVYGLSARGLAIGTAAPEGEEFARFTQIWIEVPERGVQSVVVRALLESASCTGAYEFTISPGETTVMQTRCTLFPRREIQQIGIAPLTSMYFFGPSRRAGVDDFRDAVHDSSGLQMVTGAGRRIWRSLANPQEVQVSAFVDENPKGFGLSQRQREFAYYQDAEARYEKRPTCWVEPVGGWGRGSVILVEIPVRSEFNDNIVAFWRPEAPLQPADQGHEFRYRLHWGAAPPDAAPLGRVQALRSGRAVNAPDRRVLVVDFRKDSAWAEGITVEAFANGAPVSDVSLHHLPDENGLRAAFVHDPDGAEVTEFELTLMGPDGPETETWLYRLDRP
ncbi:glucan biosynthesis protein G [Meridianimarinicoccus roseus]|uniref:Glucan biosynthesis protein G n=1 Tax=Meridianimarinicoccus roseus TaxID=2072018 RepID=A0A2V2LCN2_9RHOB|nr:glucan biosynthesis protein [Meridianimarinicoccus roseus]PWR03300.1 glucan biosynthesis protein G [Meridianimarinicoccus roseus]